MEANNTSSIFNASADSPSSSTAMPYPYPIVFLFLYTITAVLSIVGNVLVVIVLIVRKRLTKGVRYSLVNLAAADFFLAVLCIPFTCINQVYGQWLLPAAMCNIVMFVQDSMQVVSVLTLTVIGIDRYFAILFPFKFLWLRSDHTIVIALIVIWLVAIGDCMIVLLYAEVQTSVTNGMSVSQCRYAFPSNEAESGYALSNFFITYPVPIVILVFSYTSIAWKLFHRTSPGNADAERDLQQRQSMIKVIKMLVLIVAVFVLCWSPLQILVMISLANPDILIAMDSTTLKILFVWFSWFAMSNCFANPFIYSFSNNEFWKDLKSIFGKIINVHREKKGKLNYQLSNDSAATTTSELSLQKIN